MAGAGSPHGRGPSRVGSKAAVRLADAVLDGEAALPARGLAVPVDIDAAAAAIGAGRRAVAGTGSVIAGARTVSGAAHRDTAVPIVEAAGAAAVAGLGEVGEGHQGSEREHATAMRRMGPLHHEASNNRNRAYWFRDERRQNRWLGKRGLSPRRTARRTGRLLFLALFSSSERRL